MPLTPDTKAPICTPCFSSIVSSRSIDRVKFRYIRTPPGIRYLITVWFMKGNMKNLEKEIQFAVYVTKKMSQFPIFWHSVLHTDLSGRGCLMNSQKSSSYPKVVWILNASRLKTDQNILTQYLLDPISFNLETRVHISDPIVPTLFKLSRDYCSAIHEERTRKLHKLLGNW